MTKTTDVTNQTPITVEDTDLQTMLDDAQNVQVQKSQDVNIEELYHKIKDLESKLADSEQITKKAQSDYIHMKFDFDSYMRRNEEAAKTAKVDTLVDVVKKFTPFIDSLRQSLANIPEEHADDVLVQ
jgi:molecular chaperone GrpE (heat shock protein)